MRRVEKWSLGYELLRPWGRLILWISHRKIVIEGKENIPKNQAVILAPNHQNALSDSLAILVNIRLQPVFLGRADMFHNKIAASVLNFFKISPVFRIRDGKDSLGKNTEVFQNCVNILKSNKSLCIYPEAAHNGQKCMLPHKKAISRISFLAAQETNFDLDIKIVPIGIYYSHYYNYKRKLCVKFGTPISTKDYYDSFKSDGEAKASMALRNDLLNAIKGLMVNVNDRKAYDLYDVGFDLLRQQALGKLALPDQLKNYVAAEQSIIKVVEDELESQPIDKEKLLEKARLYKKLRSHSGFTESLITNDKMNFLRAILNYLIVLVLLPFGIFGLLANGWLFYIVRYSYRGKVKDTHFWSTLAFGLTFFLFPIWYLIQFFVINSFVHDWLITLGILVLSVFSNLLAWEAGNLFSKTNAWFKFNRLKKSGQLKKLLSTRSELMNFFEGAMQR